jgi:hypothetical protein
MAEELNQAIVLDLFGLFFGLLRFLVLRIFYLLIRFIIVMTIIC